MEEKYLVCQDTLEGIFTGIYEAYALREGHNHIHIETAESNLRLFASYIQVKTDREKALKVARTLEERLGQEAYLDICRAITSEDEEKGEAVYKTVVCGLAMKNGRQVMGNLADRYVHKVFELSRNASNEIHHLQGFLRFQELDNGVLFARIGPKNNIVTFLAPHFADRLPLCNFIIHDEKRGIYAIHPASQEWYLATGQEIEPQLIGRYSAEEMKYQDLFRFFCHKIAIKDRENLKLQRNLLPLRFQDYMAEFRK